MSTTLMVKIAVALVVGGGLVLVKVLAKQRAAKLEASGGCVACGSSKAIVRGVARTCMDCGYEGAADGGGKLHANDIDNMYDD